MVYQKTSRHIDGHVCVYRDDLQQMFHLPLAEAACQIGLCEVTTLLASVTSNDGRGSCGCSRREMTGHFDTRRSFLSLNSCTWRILSSAIL
jgi:hypothetical protein